MRHRDLRDDPPAKRRPPRYSGPPVSAIVLEKDLVAIKAEVENRRSVVAVELSHTYPLLVKTGRTAEAEIDLVFDFHNRTNLPSPELEAIYFYTGTGWTVSQDKQECLLTKSDLAGFKVRHFLKPPIRRLQAGAWAQIKVSMNKYVQFAKEGTPLQDSYRLTGRVLVRLTTSEGDFDYPIPIDLTVEEFPF